MLHSLAFLVSLFCLVAATVAATPAQALSLTAEGQAMVVQGDREAARRAAIRDASQQALLQAGARVRSHQRVEGGVLVRDDLDVRLRGELDEVEILDERLEGNLLRVLIRARVATETDCRRSATRVPYRKKVAVARFRLADPAQARLGGFTQSGRRLAAALAREIQGGSHLEVLPALELAPTTGARQLAEGPLRLAPEHLETLDVQFVVSGTIEDLSPLDPLGARPGNILKSWYDSLDVRGSQHLRYFALSLQIHDAYSGQPLWARSYRTAGRWLSDRHQKTGFLTPAFAATDYGRQVRTLIPQLSNEIRDALACQPFRTHILAVEGRRVTLEGGTNLGLRPGDELEVYRRQTHYRPDNRPYTRLENTRETLVINQVFTDTAEGNLSAIAESLNIQPDDVVMAR